jgi:hypothetical protein
MVRRRRKEVLARATSMMLLLAVTGLIVFDSFRDSDHYIG